jgi:hypothetical protein
MNKGLLIWNVVITIALAAAVFSGCATMDPEFAGTVTEVKNNRALIEQVAELATQNSETINSMNTDITKNTMAVNSLQANTEAAIAAVQTSFEQYVQQYVEAYVEKALQ